MVPSHLEISKAMKTTWLGAHVPRRGAHLEGRVGGNNMETDVGSSLAGWSLQKTDPVKFFLPEDETGAWRHLNL